MGDLSIRTDGFATPFFHQRRKRNVGIMVCITSCRRRCLEMMPLGQVRQVALYERVPSSGHMRRYQSTC